MSRLTWDALGTRTYETGISHGVLYLPTGGAIPWNGLTGFEEAIDTATEPAYVDGRKYLDRDIYGNFAGKLTAFTYPDELEAITGVKNFAGSVYVGNQPPQAFSVSYRTAIGDDVQGIDRGYRIHVLYNVLAIPDDTTYATADNNVAPVEFSWTITTTPEAVTGFRPTAHVILDPSELDPVVFAGIEEQLYGSSTADPSLPSLNDMTQAVIYAGRITITDNGDGTWTATGPDSNVYFLDSTTAQIDGVDTVSIDSVTLQVSTTIL